MNFVYRHGGTKDGGRGAEGAQAPPDLDRSVNPISTRRDRLCPPRFYEPLQILRPNAIPGL